MLALSGPQDNHIMPEQVAWVLHCADFPKPLVDGLLLEDSDAQQRAIETHFESAIRRKEPWVTACQATTDQLNQLAERGRFEEANATYFDTPLLVGAILHPDVERANILLADQMVRPQNDHVFVFDRARVEALAKGIARHADKRGTGFNRGGVN